MIGICRGFDLSGLLHAFPFFTLPHRRGEKKEKPIDTLDQWLQRLKLSRAPSSAGCHSKSERRQLFTLRLSCVVKDSDKRWWRGRKVRGVEGGGEEGGERSGNHQTAVG